MIPPVGVTGPFEGFFCHEHQFESATSIFHFVLGRFDARIQIVVREQAGDGDQQTERRRDQALRDTTRDRRRCAQLIPTHHTEGVHHARHCAQQSQQGRCRNNGIEDGETPTKPLQLHRTRLADGLADRKIGVGQGKPQNPRATKVG